MTNCATTTPQWSYALGNLVNSVAVSADGSLLIAGTFADVYGERAGSAGGNQAFGTYGFSPFGSSPNTPTWSQTLDTKSEGIYWVALSGNGKFAASGGKMINDTYPKGAGIIQAFDASSGDVLLNYPLPAGDNQATRVNKVALSADGSVLVAVAGSSLYVSTWNGSAYTTPAVTVVETSGAWMDTVAVSDDGTFIVVGASSGNVHVFKNASGTVTPAGVYLMPNLKKEPGVGATCRCAVFAPGGHWFAVCGGNSDTGGAVCLFNATTFSQVPQPLWWQQAKGPLYYVTLPGATALPPVAAVATNTPWEIITADEGAPAPAATDSTGQIALLKVGVGPQPIIAKTFATSNAPNSASFDPTGKYLAVADGYPPNTGTGDFYLLDGSSLGCIWTFATPKMSWPIQVAAGGGWVAAGSDDGSAYLFKTT